MELGLTHIYPLVNLQPIEITLSPRKLPAGLVQLESGQRASYVVQWPIADRDAGVDATS